MSKRVVFVLTALVLLFCQCEKHHDEEGNGRDYPSRETFKVIDNCMTYMSTNPQKAHYMLDSLKDAKLMTPQRCDYYHAMIMFSGENEIDSALVICNRLLDEGQFGDDSYLEEEICVLASDITTSGKRHVEALKFAKRGIAICHGNERMRSDEATLMGRVGVAEQGLGQIEQARETYARAYKLLKENTSFGDLIALISLQKKEAGLYKGANDYDKVISIGHDVIGMVERFDNDPSFIEQRPESMQESSPATHEFANFYKCQMYSLIANAYRLKIQKGFSTNVQADTDSVKAYVEKWNNTEGSHTVDNIASVLPELYFAGKYVEFAQAKAQVEESYRRDSLVSEYVDFLTLVAEDAEKHHDLKTSNAYLKRAVVVSDSIRRHEMMHELSQQMSLNMVQEQELARQDAEHQVSRQRIIIMLLSAILVLMIVAGLIIAFLVRKNRENEHIIESTQHDLEDSKEEIKELVHQLEETKTDKAISNNIALYERIERVMKEEELYLKPELDIMMLSRAVCSSRSAVSSCINSITGKIFRQWLAEYRLSMFVQMMKDNPDDSIDVIMQRCGYKDQSTFRRQFKTIYGMTAGEYRKQLEANNNI